jgi:hypothetical protein
MERTISHPEAKTAVGATRTVHYRSKALGYPVDIDISPVGGYRHPFTIYLDVVLGIKVHVNWPNTQIRGTDSWKTVILFLHNAKNSGHRLLQTHH